MYKTHTGIGILCFRFLGNAFEGGNRAGGIAGIVAPHHHGVIGVRSHHHEVDFSGKRQHLIAVLQQHNALTGHLEGEGFMLFRGNHALGNLRPGVQVVVVKVTEFKTRNQQTAQTTIEVGLLDITPLDGCRQVLILRTTLHICTCQYGLCRCLSTILSGVMPTG